MSEILTFIIISVLLIGAFIGIATIVTYYKRGAITNLLMEYENHIRNTKRGNGCSGDWCFFCTIEILRNRYRECGSKLRSTSEKTPEFEQLDKKCCKISDEIHKAFDRTCIERGIEKQWKERWKLQYPDGIWV